MRPSTLAEAVDRVRAGVSRDVALAEFVDSFLLAPDDGTRLAALEVEPKQTDDPQLDALAGAIAEYLAKQYRLGCVPAWASHPRRRLDEPWFTTSSTSPALREYLSFASPAEFRSHNIFTDEQPLRRARSHLPYLKKARAAGRSMIIAIDGPAASGKGTLGKRLAAHFGLRHLDTGLIYRAVAKALLDAGHRLDDVAQAVAAARALDPARFDEAVLKRHEIGEAASLVSALPQVRAALLAFQRDFGRAPPGAVLDGRDIGTVIFPDADVKIFVDATPQVRAGRRAIELSGHVSEADVLADILRRDERDRNRAAAPLKAAPDAHLLDTTHLDIDAAFRAAVDIVEAVRAGRERG